jgi:hypothetical protein
MSRLEERREGARGAHDLERQVVYLIDSGLAAPVNAAVPEADSDESWERRIMAKQTSTETPVEYKRLSREELENLAGEPLPKRAAMSLINANVAAPINAALALNVASDNSVAYANAEQTAEITQSN